MIERTPAQKRAYNGTVTFPPYLKGDKKNGVVEKDYVVTGT